ncbi:helix-turn-helix domain-containing protein [Streptomyces narbonensis]|uniref:helix-turn-helix domain-containing protein n=1 Tax=Streptomyces narbonensis TaxID=67333 RepID=UPI001E38991F|nr:helix-turn-helix transcriptional regulator [Streptomyces narbonensis]
MTYIREVFKSSTDVSRRRVVVNRKELDPDSGVVAAYGARLRRLREERGWKQEDLAARTSYSGKHISAVETARRSPTLKLSREIDSALGVTGTAPSFEREWRKMRDGVFLEGFPEYVHYERQAVEIRMFDIGVVPGLCQTVEYAEVLAAFNVERGSVTAEQAVQRVDLLCERQQLLDRRRPPLHFVVLDESCLRQMVGGPEVMAAQLDHLVELAARPFTFVQVAPFSMGERRPSHMPLTLLTLADRSMLAYTESQARGHLEREGATLSYLNATYHRLAAEALSPAASLAMIKDLRQGLL